jgi:DNA-binding MarR family transcriptional regulator
MEFRERLERAKGASVGHLLFRAARLLDERAVGRLRSSAAPRLRRAHTALLAHIGLDGTRVSEIATRAGITKQAAGQRLAELAAMGIVRSAVDPRDRRARTVRFTPRGRRALLHGLGLLERLERELAGELGTARLARLREDLARLVAVLEGG